MDNEKKKRKPAIIALEIVVLVLLLCVLGFIIYKVANAPSEPTISEPPIASAEPSETPTPTPSEDPYEIKDFRPHAVESTQPENLVKSTAINVDGENVDSYISPYKINFESGSKYTELEGVVTFRGNNYRDSAAYGTANVTDGKFSTVWTNSTSGLSGRQLLDGQRLGRPASNSQVGGQY